MEIAGATVFLSGANRGIGLALARELSGRGARVLAGVRDLASMPPVGGDVTPVPVDLASRSSITAASEAAGPVDILINNAGVLQAGQLEEEEVDHLYEVLQVNLAGA